MEATEKTQYCSKNMNERGDFYTSDYRFDIALKQTLSWYISQYHTGLWTEFAWGTVCTDENLT